MVLIAVPAVVAALAAPVAIRWASRLGLVDRPGPLKVHARPVPYVGGVVVLLAIAPFVAPSKPSLLVPLVLAFTVGLVDDAFGLSPRTRLAAEVVVGAAVAAAVGAPSVLAWVAIAAGSVLLLNAVNLLDGLDGLATSVALVSAAAFAVVASGSTQVLAATVVGALAGFLVWNWRPARAFLGDSGSYLVGTALATLLAAVSVDEPASVSIGAVLFVAVPLLDTSAAIVRRWRAGAPLFEGDRSHVYDQLVDRGLGVRSTVLVCAGAQLALGGVGVVAGELPLGAALALTAGVLAAAAVSSYAAFVVARPGSH
jgi:UDP-GlcNAc:undecaprenyl-phosphate GlcNAc-1-phosphate transferase